MRKNIRHQHPRASQAKCLKIIDYKPGAGGSIGADIVIKSPADGYTLLMANTGTLVINPFVYTKNACVTLRDFTPIARTAQQPLALVVNNDVPVKPFAEFVDYAKKILAR